MVAHNRRGFTLIELLVVIVIIGTLVGLLIPAVMAVRSRARITQCMNNQKQLATAIISYDAQRGHLPGYANKVGDAAVTWAVVLLPYLGRNDVWQLTEDTANWPANISNINAEGFLCPDETRTNTYNLSYVVNVGPTAPKLSDETTSDDFNTEDEDGPFCNRVAIATTIDGSATTTTPRNVSLADVRSPARTPLLSECAYPVDTTRTAITASTARANRLWNETTTSLPSLTATDLNTAHLTAADLGFVWPATGTVGSPTVLPPIHPGIVIVTFCDGHTEKLPDNTSCAEYPNPAMN